MAVPNTIKPRKKTPVGQESQEKKFVENLSGAAMKMENRTNVAATVWVPTANNFRQAGPAAATNATVWSTFQCGVTKSSTLCVCHSALPALAGRKRRETPAPRPPTTQTPTSGVKAFQSAAFQRHRVFIIGLAVQRERSMATVYTVFLN